MSKFSLLDIFLKNDISFFCGVPDSLLANFSLELEENKKKISHIITPNEGNAIGTAIGYNLSTDKVPLVYMQNSGLGNAVNPIVSLASKQVWKVPIFLLIGWRGNNKLKDEPQHLKQGKITLPFLKLMNIDYKIYSEKMVNKQVSNLKAKALKDKKVVALVLPAKYTASNFKRIIKNISNNANKITRIKVIEEVLKYKSDKDILISTTGKTSRELYLAQKNIGLPHKDLFVVGGMGHASSIAYGIAKSIKNKRIFLLDGDGALLMHMGILALLGKQKHNTFYHILLNNGTHDSVGGQPTCINDIDLKLLVKSCNYKIQKNIYKSGKLTELLYNLRSSKGSFFFNIKIAEGSISPLPRPKEMPFKNKALFQKNFIKK